MKRVLTVVFAGLAVCAGAFAKSQPDNKIDVHTASDYSTTFDKLAAAWNAKNPSTPVVLHYTPNSDYDDKLKTLVSGKNKDMDVIWIRNPAPVQQYITNKALYDITPLIKESGLDLSPIVDSTLKGATQGGKYYGLPTTGSAWMIFYNKALFDAKGLPPPVNLTWDQYLDLAKQLTGTQGGTKYWGGLCPPWVLNLGAAAAGEYLTAPSPMPYTRRYSEALYRAYITDHSHPNIGEMSIGTFDVNALFASGTVYMMINGDWTFRLLEAPFEYGAAPLPIFPGLPAGSTAGSVGFLSIVQHSANPKEAYKFIEWALTGEGAAIFAEEPSVPAYPTPAALKTYKKQISVPGVDYRFSSRINQEQTTEPYYSDLSEAFNQEIQLYLLGEQPLDRTFTNFYRLRDEIIKK